jgi:hypothetical protein
LFCLPIKSDLAGQIDIVKSHRRSGSISLKQDGLHCQESKASAMATRQPKGCAYGFLAKVTTSVVTRLSVSRGEPSGPEIPIVTGTGIDVAVNQCELHH